MQFKIGNLEIAPVKQNKNNGGRYSGGRVATAIFNGNRFFALLDGKQIPIKLTVEQFNHIDIIYSNHLNDYYELWKPHKCSKKDPGIDNRYKFWSILRPKQKIAGKIIDGEFNLDLDYVNKQNNKYYEKYLNKF